jgi:hypothetical protein
VKVKASRDFQYYRLIVFKGEITKEDYRNLQAGKTVDIDSKLYNKYTNIFEKVSPKKEVK